MNGMMDQLGMGGLLQLLMGQFGQGGLMGQPKQQGGLVEQQQPHYGSPGGPGWKGTPPIMPVENQKTDIGRNMPLPVVGQAMGQGMMGLLPMLLGQMSPQMQGTMGLWQMLQGMRR